MDIEWAIVSTPVVLVKKKRRKRKLMWPTTKNLFMAEVEHKLDCKITKTISSIRE